MRTAGKYKKLRGEFAVPVTLVRRARSGIENANGSGTKICNFLLFLIF